MELAAQPPAPEYARTPLSDDEVRLYIRAALAENPGVRPTPLLARLRRSGRACEHGRFRKLFLEVEAPRHA
jgi:hypothetical protein